MHQSGTSSAANAPQYFWDAFGLAPSCYIWHVNSGWFGKLRKMKTPVTFTVGLVPACLLREMKSEWITEEAQRLQDHTMFFREAA